MDVRVIVSSTKFHSNIRIALLKCLFHWRKYLDIQNTCTILVIWIGYLDNIANTNTRVVYYGVYSGIFGYPDIICTSRALNYLDRWVFINSSQYLNLGRSWIKRGSSTETIRINKWMNEMAGRFSSRLASKTDWKEWRGESVYSRHDPSLCSLSSKCVFVGRHASTSLRTPDQVC